MNVKSLLTVVTVALAAYACGSSDDGSGNNSNAQGGQGGSGGSAAAGTGGMAGVAGAGGSAGQAGQAGQGGSGGEDSKLTASLSGKVTDGNGKTLSGFRVQLCYQACRTKNVQSDGTYKFDKVEAATHLLELWPNPKGEYKDVWLAPTFPLTLADHEDKTLDLIWLAPTNKVKVPDKAASLEIADGIFVTLGLDTADPSMYLSGDFTEVYGVRFPDDKMPPIEGIKDAIGFWVLGPTETTAKKDGFPVKFTNTWKLSDGTKLHVWYSEQEHPSMKGHWVSAGEVTVSGNDIQGEAKLPMLGTVVLSK